MAATSPDQKDQDRYYDRAGALSADRAFNYYAVYKKQMNAPDNDKAPFFKNWNYWYALVIGFLVVLIILFTFFTKRFS